VSLPVSAPAPAPAPPAAAEPPLHADLVTFCSAEALKHVGPLNVFGPWYEPLVTSPEMKDELAKVKGGSMDMPGWWKVMSKQLADADITTCPTYEAMFKMKIDGTTPIP
jgi:hypothetical protein